MTTDLIYAPWTAGQVTALNTFQHHGRMHPFTCGAVHSSGRSPILVATPAEWICPDPSCGYTQDWAHAFMAMPTPPEAVPPTDRADPRERIAAVIHEDLTRHKVRRDLGLFGIVPRLTDAVMAVLPADSSEPHRLALSTALGLGTGAPWDAIRARAKELADEERDEQQAQVNLDQLADDLAAAIASCPGRELVPNPCRCPCYGCKHHCGAHDPSRLAAETPEPETQGAHSCGNCEGIDPDSCLMNPRRRRNPGALDRIRSLHDSLAAETDLSGPDDLITKGSAARRIATALDGWTAPERPQRGDAFEQWLKAQRDLCFGHATTWGAVDGLLDQYRLHADTGTPLSEHVCEGQAVGDCECLETLATETPDAPRREPHPTEADLRHALAVAAKFHSQDATAPAVAQTEVVHACPPDGSGLTPCCGRTPFELPLGDRISSEAPVTCTSAPAVTLPGKEG